ncbi:stage III sporulation protein AB [Caloramator quimbayensis]|uniref:Stage III sporulation protein AB n=1 Tax=Caloramator quimbayensis TaxID=1147123 RepID=A0A1T4WZB3_9CLOT|nr:stage III sporulation protein SpoIIIAB [Caloramator quimbayensis]SKA81931.1 stage III sporulation protein AB [Caloramator quimbayensis]
MLKILGSIIVVASTSVIGFLYAMIFTERVRQIRDMQYALNILESEVVFKSTPVADAFYFVSLNCTETIKNIFNHMSNLIKDRNVQSISEAFDSALNAFKSDLYFEKEETEVIKAFMQTLGCGDLEAQKKNFNITVEKLKNFEKNAEESKRKNERLYKYLGVCCGIMIVIILI